MTDDTTTTPAPAKKAAARRTGKTAQEEVVRASVEQRAEKAAAAIAAGTIWERLAAPFPQEDLERLPKPLSRDDRNKGRCEESTGARFSADGYYCGGWHTRSVHLNYVGHAGITTRLNEVLTPAGWTFGPMALTPEGLPLMPRDVFWGELTIHLEDGRTVTKNDLAANYNGPQEAWGDALRRCAMRFGVGTYLWSKSEAAHAQAQYAELTPEPEAEATPEAPAHVDRLMARLRVLGPDETAVVREWWTSEGLPSVHGVDEYQAAAVHSFLDEKGLAPANPQ